MKTSPFDLGKLEEQRKIQCPKCGEQMHITCRSLEYEYIRHCNVCGCDWSGGMVRGEPDPGSAPIGPGMPVPEEDDRPAVQYTGASFRDPNKNFDGGF
jgi:predicted RNA-binding Zn-ribbon protein involved in translation (DUF1610 family)